MNKPRDKAIDKAKNYSNQATIEMKRGDIQEAYKMMVLAYAYLEQALTQERDKVRGWVEEIDNEMAFSEYKRDWCDWFNDKLKDLLNLIGEDE